MKVIEENEGEIYVAVEQKDFPLTIESPGKKLYVRLIRPDEDISGLGLPVQRVWKDKKELLEEYLMD